MKETKNQRKSKKIEIKKYQEIMMYPKIPSQEKSTKI